MPTTILRARTGFPIICLVSSFYCEAGKAGGFLAADWSDGSPLGPLQRHSFALHEQLGKAFGHLTDYRRVTTLAVKTAHANGGRRLIY